MGSESTQEQYEAIEQVYNALANCNKEEFVELYKKHPVLYDDVAKLVRRCTIAERNVEGFKTFCNGIGERIIDAAWLDELTVERFESIAADVMGSREKVVRYKILNGYDLTDADKDIVKEVFNQKER